ATAALVKAYDIPVPPSALASTAAAAAAAAAEMGFPVVLKIQSPDIAHKTEAGGVRLGVQAGEVEGAFAEIVANAGAYAPAARMEGALELIRSLKTAPILAGTRGEAAGDLAALAGLISRVADLARSETAIEQLDLNPVFVYPAGQGIVAVDAL